MSKTMILTGVAGAAVGDEAVGQGMNVKVDDNGSSYETNGEIFCVRERKPVKCVPFTAQVTENTTPNGITLVWPTSAGAGRKRRMESNGRTERRSIKVSVTFEDNGGGETRVYLAEGDKAFFRARNGRRGRAPPRPRPRRTVRRSLS